jgi:glucose-6-phosphate 1-dehydrogenase
MAHGRPTQVIILGASGDLTARKLIPALYASFSQDVFADPVQVVGVARRPWETADFREILDTTVPAGVRISNPQRWAQFLDIVDYVRTELDHPEQYRALSDALDASAGEHKGNIDRVFYLAIKPELFLATVTGLKDAGLLTEANGLTSRVVVEKPFGHDLSSAEALNASLLNLFSEKQLYRIDHYLGKETVQNILAFRFRNAMFEPLWDHRYVELVQITVAEEVIVGDRGGYYDTSGAINDILQNHLLQLLALVAMEPPSTLDGDAIRNEKVKVLDCLRLPEKFRDLPEHIVRGQYDGYLGEKGVAEGSQTETYIATRAYIDNWRWGGVPFLLRTGKGMSSRFTSITLQFRMPPVSLFGEYEPDVCHMRPNHLRMRIQPNEGIDLLFDVKKPGAGNEMQPASLNFNYDDFFGIQSPEAYQRLLQDVIVGDQSLFIRSDEVEACWRWTDSLKAVLGQVPLETYQPGGWGPERDYELFRECEGRWAHS